MTVRKKIIMGLYSILIIGLLLGITGLISVSKLADMSKEQHEIQEAGNGVTSVLNAHYTWRQNLTEAALGMKDFTGSLDPTSCALGKWKDSEDAKSITDAELLTLIKGLDAPHTYIHTEASKVVAAITAGDQAEASRIVLEDILPSTQETISILESMEARYGVILDDKTEELTTYSARMNTVMIVLVAAGVIVAALLAWVVTASIMKPIRKLAQGARVIATGDLNVDVHYPVRDEIGKLADAFGEIVESSRQQVAAAEQIAAGNLAIQVTPRSDKDAMNIAFQDMLDNLNKMFSGIRASTGQVTIGSKQIADGAQGLAEGAAQQAAAVEELSSSITEIEEKTKTNANMAEKAANLSDTIKGSAEKGSHQMDEMMTAVREINEAGKNIGRVIKVIDDIAFQTNILALNAAVEAARAGQYGKGFAVVAEEVRNLAAKSAEAAKDTGELIANSIEKAELGARIAESTAASLSEIVSEINESSQLVSEIARSSEEQTAGITQINKGIDQVAKVVSQNSAAAEESAAASQEMSGQANLLEEMISRFKLSGSVENRSSYVPQSSSYHEEGGSVYQEAGTSRVHSKY